MAADTEYSAITYLYKSRGLEARHQIDRAPEYVYIQLMNCLEREEEAMEAVEKALEEGMPPVLLAPLCWFKQKRPDFYEKYVVPLLAKHE